MVLVRIGRQDRARCVVLCIALNATIGMVVLVVDGEAERGVISRVQIARTVVHIPVHARAVVLDLGDAVEIVIHIRNGEAVAVLRLCEQTRITVICIGRECRHAVRRRPRLGRDCSAEAVIG